MKVLDLVWITVKTIRTRKIQSVLTVLGIIVAVISLISILSIADWAKSQTLSQLSQFGDDKIVVVPTSSGESSFIGFNSFEGSLNEKDAKAVSSIPGVKQASYESYERTVVSFKGETVRAVVYGSPRRAIDMYSDYLVLSKGRFYHDNERNVVVLGNKAANELFGKTITIGKTIKIKGEPFKVVGILKEVGNSLSSQVDDNVILIPYQKFKDLFDGRFSSGEVSLIFVQVSEGSDPSEVAERIRIKIASRHGKSLDNADFSVITMDYILNRTNSIMSLLTISLFVISGVASLVSALGIANTLVSKVVEMKKNLGIMSAIGMKRSDLAMIVVIYSFLMSVSGFVAGFAFSYLILITAGFFLGSSIPISFFSVAVSFASTVFVSIIASVLPALKASYVDPIEAMR